jgi:hypothetical protein
MSLVQGSAGYLTLVTSPNLRCTVFGKITIAATKNRGEFGVKIPLSHIRKSGEGKKSLTYQFSLS